MNNIETKLLVAICEGKVRKINSILESDIDPNFQDEEGKTPLIHAVCCEADEIKTHVVRMLLRHDCDVNVQDNYDRTALMYACMEPDRMDIVRLLTRQKSCNPNLTDQDGYTAIMHAVAASNTSALTTLLSSSITKTNVDINIRNKNGITALELAIKLQQFQCCKILAADGGARSNNVRDQKGLNLMLGRESSGMSAQAFGEMLGTKKKTRNKSRTGQSVYPSRAGTPAPERTQDSRASYDDRNDYLRSFRQERPDLVMSRADTSQRSNLIFSRDSSSSSAPWVDSPRRSKRNLTPISMLNNKNNNNSHIISTSPSSFEPLGAESTIFGNKMRLPSIPSGKRLCLVSNQGGLDHPGTDV